MEALHILTLNVPFIMVVKANNLTYVLLSRAFRNNWVHHNLFLSLYILTCSYEAVSTFVSPMEYCDKCTYQCLTNNNSTFSKLDMNSCINCIFPIYGKVCCNQILFNVHFICNFLFSFHVPDRIIVQVGIKSFSTFYYIILYYSGIFVAFVASILLWNIKELHYLYHSWIVTHHANFITKQGILANSNVWMLHSFDLAIFDSINLCNRFHYFLSLTCENAIYHAYFQYT